jgi:hypothetical protein
MKPRIFLGSSGQQERLLQALTRGLRTTVSIPGDSALDFAAFVFARASSDAVSGQASPRDNVVLPSVPA